MSKADIDTPTFYEQHHANESIPLTMLLDFPRIRVFRGQCVQFTEPEDWTLKSIQPVASSWRLRTTKVHFRAIPPSAPAYHSLGKTRKR